MTLEGTVQNGVIVLSAGHMLPEGTVVHVAPQLARKESDHSKTLGEKLVELAEWAESQPCDLPEDLAKNHDHYLYGVPKRE